MAPELSSHHIILQALFLLLVIQAIIVKSESQFSKSLKSFHGAQKGHTIKGLNQVKQYLKAFGYYSTDGSSDLSDYFDDSLESALKTYQRHYRLKVVGRIDSDTIEKMSIPRCGVRDIFNSSNGGVRFGMVVNYSFFDGMPRWNKRQLTYRFRSSAKVSNVRQLIPIMVEACRKWGDVSNFTFREAKNHRTDIVVGFHRGSHGDDYPFDGPGNVLAHSFAPRYGMLHFDAEENWSTSNVPRSTQIDLESVAVHEMGHILGLGHSQDINAIMYPYYRFKRDLEQDDIDGIRALYFA